ncbi:MAG TPA: hypothetical protein VJM12_16895 [Pyrinomonadaceae bacterium]|nr:hypothetical protein [Pyrinomonadaceae bacterium]
MTGTSFIGLLPFQWIALLTAVLTLLLLADALAGHYRSGFTYRTQYVPFISGGLLIVAAGTAAILPTSAWINRAMRTAGWFAVASGLIGLAFHHYFGIAKKPGGYKWLLHYLMYGAPQLAPLALALTGLLAIISARGLAGDASIGGLSVRRLLLILVAIALTGAILQATILHYRGAFNNPAMYAPLSAPVLTVIATIWIALAPNNVMLVALKILLWLTFLIGFIGLGMHLRGFGRQMAGLYLLKFNWLEGPPAWAPALFAAFAGVGLVTVYLL